MAANTPPVVDDQTVVTDVDTPTGITLTSSDPAGGGLTWTLASTGAGQGSLTGSGDTWFFIPDSGVSAIDVLIATATDINGLVSTGYVTVIIGGGGDGFGGATPADAVVAVGWSHSTSVIEVPIPELVASATSTSTGVAYPTAHSFTATFTAEPTFDVTELLEPVHATIIAEPTLDVELVDLIVLPLVGPDSIVYGTGEGETDDLPVLLPLVDPDGSIVYKPRVTTANPPVVHDPDPDSPPGHVSQIPDMQMQVFAGGLAQQITAVSCQPVMNDKGSGSCSVFSTDAVSGITTGQAVSFAIDGHEVFGGKAKDIETVPYSLDEESGNLTSFSVDGYLSEWAQMIVYPDLGAESPENMAAPLQETRFFDWTASTGMDRTSWGDSAVTDPMYGKGKKQRFANPDGWPTRTSKWIWGVSSVNPVPAGFCYFAKIIPGGEQETFKLFASAYDSYELWIDGIQYLDNPGGGNGGSQNADIILGNHFHLLTAKVHNAGGRAGFNFAMHPYVNSNGLLGEPTVVSNASWQCLAYTDPPKFTVGKMLRVLLEEAQARGTLTGWNLGFSDTSDSAGAGWPAVQGLSCPTGIDGLQLLSSLTDQYLEFTNHGRTLLCYANSSPHGSGGGFAGGVNLQEMHVRTMGDEAPNTVLFKLKDQYRQYPQGASGGKEIVVNLGNVANPKIADAIGPKVLATAGPTTSVSVSSVPGARPIPIIDPGDAVATPAGTYRAVGPSYTMDVDGKVQVSAELESLGLAEWQKVQRQIASIVGAAETSTFNQPKTLYKPWAPARIVELPPWSWPNELEEGSESPLYGIPFPLQLTFLQVQIGKINGSLGTTRVQLIDGDHTPFAQIDVNWKDNGSAWVPITTFEGGPVYVDATSRIGCRIDSTPTSPKHIGCVVQIKASTT